MSEPAMRPPRLVLIAGATSVGKSTLAHGVAAAQGFARLASTDAIREVMRLGSTPKKNPALHRSSYSMGETGDAINDWLDAAAVVEAGVEAVIDRARGEGVDLIVEGVHIVPSSRWLRDWRKSGGIALGVYTTVETEARHLEFIEGRESRTHRSIDPYLNAFDRIRQAQDGIIERGKISNWLQVDSFFHREPVARVEQALNEAWYERKQN